MRKKICFIVSSPLSAKVFLKAHMQQLKKTYDIWLVANFSDNSNFIIDDVEFSGVKNIKMSRSSISLKEDVMAAFHLVKFLKQKKFDAVHSITPKAGLIGIIASKLAGIQLRTHTFTGQIWANYTGVKRFIFKNIDRVINYTASKILVDGNAQRTYLIEEKIVGADSQVLANGSICGVNRNQFKKDEAFRKEIRSELGYKENDVVFIFIGRLCVDKGVPELIQAFIELKKEIDNIRLLLVGPDEGKIKDSIDTQEGLTFYGYTSRPEYLLNAADIFCLPSHREGFGSSIIEASATSLPVICSDAYGMRDAFVPGETGLLHKIGNVNDLKDKMALLAKDNGLRKKLGVQGSLFIAEKFDESVVVNAFVEYYKESLG